MKNIFTFLMILLLPAALIITACGDDNAGRTDPSFLAGIWKNNKGSVTFYIEEDLTFICDATIPLRTDIPLQFLTQETNQGEARLVGGLDYTNTSKNLGPNDFILVDLGIAEYDENDPWHEGNKALDTEVVTASVTYADRLEQYAIRNLHCTLRPLNAAKTSFKFSSQNPYATGFFGSGGDFTKQP